MNTAEIAQRLVNLCREGKWEQAQQELYHPDIISIEPEETGGAVTRGLDGILEKNEMWEEMSEEVHETIISDPIVADGYFACTMTMDVTIKNQGRVRSSEICVYQVKDGKIVSERFFHA